MNVAEVADELAASLGTITDLRVYPFPPDGLAAPCAIVGYPQAIQFDVSGGRGQDKLVMPVYLVVDRNWDRSSAEQFAGYTAGSGAASIKAVLQNTAHVAFSTCRVTGATFNVIAVGSIEYWAATFLVDVFGPGA